jgi:hypothetical protein
VIDWTPGSLQLVNLIQVASAPAFSLRGHRCSDGRTLRFSYGGLPPVTSIASRPIPSAVFETAGEDTVNFDAYDISGAVPGSHSFLGYMLFTSEGDWAIETFSGDVVLGTAVLRVKARAP